MKKIIFGLTLLVSFSIYQFWPSGHDNFSKLAMLNIEALASDSDEKLDCSYNREDGRCTVKIGVGGKIKIAGVGIVKADASGEISFDGKVICSAGGIKACRPIECVDLYEVILKK